ncbi:unnamed protein product, partial [Hapterophycus canaliculatus]
SNGESKGREGEATRFIEKLGFTDRSSHCHEIRSMRFAKGLELLVVVEGTAILKIYSSGPHKIGQIEPAIAMRTKMIDSKRSVRITASKPNFRGRGGGGGATARAESATATNKGTEESMAVLAMDFIGRGSQAAVSCADGYLTVWDLETLKLLRYVRLRDVQVGLRFCPFMDILTSWGVDEFNHEIIVWDVDTLTVLHVLDGHSEPVKDTYEVAPPLTAGTSISTEKAWDPILVTTGMDHKLVLWDLRVGNGRNLSPRKLFVLVGHYHGVLSLAYSSEHDLLLSAGFDFDANCWDRSTRHLHMKLVGHRLSLIGVVVVEHETQRAVTGDEGGSFRLWDIQRGHSDHGTCLQAFSLRSTRVSPRSMAVVWKGGLIVAGSKMHVFRAATSVPVEAAPLGAWFSSYTGELCVVLREAFFFDAATGRVKRRTFQQTQGREITAFCMDARHKKAVVGDQRGGLRIYDGVTGRWIMSATPHLSEVSALLFVDEDNAFVSAGWDGMIQVHDARVCSCSATRSKMSAMQVEGEQAPVGHRCALTLRSVMNAHDGDITLMEVSSRLGLIATASSDLTVRLWDYGLLRLEEVIVAHRQEITCVRFLDPLPCLATADMTGKVLVWATRPHPNGGTLLLVMRNTVITAGNLMPDPTQEPSGRHARVQRKVVPTPITCIAFRHNKPVCVNPDETDDTQGVRRDKTAVRRNTRSEALSCRDEAELTEKQPSLPGRQMPSSAAGGNVSRTTPTPWEVRSILFTGDELGSIKVWDLTEILLEKLGPATIRGTKVTGDKATIPPSSFGAASHHFIHYRQGPLDGVSLQAAVRFRELIDIARVLRRGEHLQTPTPALNSLTQLRPPGQGTAVRASGGGKNTTRPPSELKSSAGSLIASSTTERSRDCSSAARRQEELGLDRNAHSRATDFPNQPSSGTFPDVCGGQHCGRRPPGPKEHAEATLNAKPDDVDPVASWMGHEDSITSMQIISNPPSILTGSLDSSARLFSLDGSLLGVMEKTNAGGKTFPWLFEPPPIGRNAEARDQTSALEPKLKRVRQEERQPMPTAGDAVDSEVATDQHPQGRFTLTSSPRKAPVDGSLSGPASSSLRRAPTGQERGTREERAQPSSRNSPDGARGGRGEVAAIEGNASFQAQSITSAVCLSRVKELTQVRDTAPVPSFETESDSMGTGEDAIEERLLNEAREGRRSPISSVGNGGGYDKRRGYYHHTARASSGASEPLPPPQKLPPNLTAEREKKHAKRTPPFLGLRPEEIRSQTALSLNEIEGDIEGHGTEEEKVDLNTGQTENARRTPPILGSMVPLAQRSTPNVLQTQRSVMTLPSARSNRSNVSTRPVISTKAAVARRLAADHRRRRMDCIVDSVRRIGQREVARSASLPDTQNQIAACPGIGNNDHCRVDSDHTSEEEMAEGWGPVGAGEARTGTVIISSRVQEVISRFERLVDHVEADGQNASDNQADQRVKSMRRQLEARTAARQEAIKHNERYRRAQRYDLISLRETQQRRQEAMVGLTGPSGERFGPYSLDDVLEFQVFANYLNAHGAEHLTVRGLIENPDIQADPYSHALLQELTRSRVLQWNQPLLLDDLMQLVFHFAKHEEAKRMMAVMDIAVLLERLRDAFLADKSSLLGKNGSLPFHFVNDIDMAFRATAAEACGTCTLKELHGVMARVGSDLFPSGQEELESVAAQCGVVDGY